MTNPTIKIVDTIEGTEIEREMTASELEAYNSGNAELEALNEAIRNGNA